MPECQKRSWGQNRFAIGAPEKFFAARALPRTTEKADAQQREGEVEPNDGVGTGPGEFVAELGVVACHDPRFAWRWPR